MAVIYVPYGTTEGQTAKIAEFISEVIQAHGHKAQTADINQAGNLIPDWYDAVIVGASVHQGKHEDYVLEFVRKNKAVLESVPSAFFSVSLSAHGDTEDAESYVKDFEKETGWRPAQVGLFSGALLYTQYGFIKRLVMKKIASDKGSLDTDTSRDYVYTEWDGVKRFAEDFLDRATTPGEML
ncbi:flavodoxin domain-containing protein [Pseudarthrobacter oxydans]|uniref:flavodoxin domain-containing protein n=1 Tax=Pseudarthrobacter oxydans TaxID=1671 RepID=UPI00344215D9